MNLKMSSIYYCDAIVILLILLGFRSRFKERYTHAGLSRGPRYLERCA